MKLLRKCFLVSRRRQACTMVPNQLSKGQSGKVSSKVGTARISKRRGGRGSMAKRAPDGIAMGER